MDTFQISDDETSNEWITAMIHLFYPQIAALLQKRDEIIAERGGRAFLKNRSWEVITEMPISIEEQINWLTEFSQAPQELQDLQDRPL